jgi:hypothetical protein
VPLSYMRTRAVTFVVKVVRATVRIHFMPNQTYYCMFMLQAVHERRRISISPYKK